MGRRRILVRAAVVAMMAVVGGVAAAPATAAQAHATAQAYATAQSSAELAVWSKLTVQMAEEFGTTQTGSAAAAGPVARPLAVPVTTILAVVQAAYNLYKSFIQNTLSVQDATNQIIAAINSAKIEILAHVDAIATAQARGCAQAAILDVSNFDVLTPANQQLFALNTTSCVTLIDSLLTAVTDKAALDQLGFALDSVGPIALIVRSRVGLSNAGLVPILVHSNQTTVTVVAPVCNSRIIEGRTQWSCRAYNGDVGGPEPSLALAQREAGARISWAVAKAVLPLLATL